ncbi:MAG: helix-turn-helix domain-containing protein [Gemmatimonadales bacterium]
MASLPQLLDRLGQVIRTLRTEAGYSQERFGFAIGVHRTYMGHLERGTANPTMNTLYLVAEGLGLSIADLLASASMEINGETRPADAARPRQDSKRPSIRGRRARAGVHPDRTTGQRAQERGGKRGAEER